MSLNLLFEIPFYRVKLLYSSHRLRIALCLRVRGAESVPVADEATRHRRTEWERNRVECAVRVN